MISGSAGSTDTNCCLISSSLIALVGNSPWDLSFVWSFSFADIFWFIFDSASLLIIPLEPMTLKLRAIFCSSSSVHYDMYNKMKLFIKSKYWTFQVLMTLTWYKTSKNTFADRESTLEVWWPKFLCNSSLELCDIFKFASAILQNIGLFKPRDVYLKIIRQHIFNMWNLLFIWISFFCNLVQIGNFLYIRN